MKYFALLPLLLISLSIFAQSLSEVQVESGPAYNADMYKVVEIFKPTSNGYYILKSKFASYGYFTIDNMYIEHLDNDMNFISIKELELKEGKNSLTFEGTVQFGDNIHLITSFVNTAQKSKYIFSQTIDPQSLTLSSPVKIAEVNQVAGDKTATGVVRVRMSNDESKVVILACPPYDINADDKPSVTVLDNNMSVIWSKTLSIPFDMTNLPFDDTHVSNNGDVILFNSTYYGPRKSTMTSAVAKALKKSDIDQMVRVLTLTNNGETQNSSQVRLANNFIYDMSAHFNDKMDVVCTGFYCGNNKFEGRSGMYMIKLKAGNLDQEFAENHPFDTKTGGMMSAVTDGVTKEKEYRYLEPRVVYSKNDGSVFLVSEREYIATSSASSSSTSFYYWGNILVSKFNAHGELEFTVTVPKLQYTNQLPANWVSFESTMKNGVLYLFFSDTEENANSTAGMVQKISNPAKSLVSVFSVNSEGEVARTFITEKDNYLNRNGLQTLEDGSVIIATVSGKKQMLNKVILP